MANKPNSKKTEVKEKYAGHKGPFPGMKVETPYPKDAVKPDDVNYLGEQLVKLSDRINEVELSMDSLRQDIKRVMGRMGL
tara:strand:+ start:73 stop:312 length:240 start_codon:yes stop_codon:yes gene_type:complete